MCAALALTAGTAPIRASADAIVASTTPPDGATNQPVDSNITVTFSTTVTLDAGAIRVACSTSGVKAVGISTVTVIAAGLPVTLVTLDPASDFAGGETCTVTVDYGGVHATDGSATAPGSHVFSFSTASPGPTVDDLLSALSADVEGVGPGKSLANKLAQIQADVAANDTVSACSLLSDFMNQVKAQRGKKLSNGQADALTAQAAAIKAKLGC
jgi:hypothetical protein